MISSFYWLLIYAKVLQIEKQHWFLVLTIFDLEVTKLHKAWFWHSFALITYIYKWYGLFYTFFVNFFLHLVLMIFMLMKFSFGLPC